MVTPAADTGGAGEGEGGRTAASLHQPWDDHRDHLTGGRVHTIAERLDGRYYPTDRTQGRDVHGWYYPDPSGRALPAVD